MKKYVSVITIILIAAGIAAAMPPRPGLKEPAAIVKARAEGRIDNPANGLIFDVRREGGGEAKIGGSRSYPVVLGFFTDTGSTFTPGQLQTMLFSTGNGVKSVNNYYRDMSFNAMSCSGSVASWYTSGNTVNYFGGGNNGMTGGTTANTYEFIKKSLAHADSFVDFSDPAYDLNNDGYVDVLWVIHAGLGGEEETSGSDWIWSHSSSLSLWGGGATYYTTNDSWIGHAGQYIKINKYIIMPEKTLYSGSGNTMIGCGVFCHEFGHALGLPDLYDTGGYSITGEGLGLFSLMAAGSWGGNYSSGARPVVLDAWCRRFLGWLTPTRVTANGYYTVNTSLTTASNSSYKLAKLGSDTTKQYWLVENRYRSAAGTFSTVRWDSLLMGQGLLIYHIDSTYTTASHLSNNDVNVNTTNGSSRNRPYGVAIEETDDTSAGYDSELWYGYSYNYGETADAWNSSSQANFDSVGTSYPVTYLNGTNSTTGGAHTLVAIRAIPAASAAMACSLFVGVATGVTGSPVGSQPFTGFQLDQAWPNPARGVVTFNYRLPAESNIAVEIFNLAGQLMDRTIVSRQKAGCHEYHWAPPAKSPGVYFFRLRAGEASLTRKFIVLH